MKELLTTHGLNHIKQKLIDAKISLSTLQWMDITKDFDALVDELDINKVDEIKLRSAINELQSTNLTLPTKHLQRIQQISATLGTKINIKFKQIMNGLHSKQNELLLDIHRWKLDAIKVNNECLINVPKVHFSSSINLNDISSFADIQISEQNESKIHHMSHYNNNPLNPFCDNYTNTDSIIIKANNQHHQNEQQIHLKYTDHRKHFINDDDINNFDRYHPKNLLDLYINDRYYSDMYCNLEHESDWIIFQILHQNEYFIPTRLELKNHSNEYAVKKLCAYIGNGKGEWFTLHYDREHIVISNENLFVQHVELNLNDDDISAEIILKNKLNYYRIELIENYGASVSDKSKFCLHYIGLYGTRIDRKKKKLTCTKM